MLKFSVFICSDHEEQLFVLVQLAITELFVVCLDIFFPKNLCSLCTPKEICYLIISSSRMQVCRISLPALAIHLLCIINSHLKIHIYQFFKLNRSNFTPVVYFKSQSSSPQKTPTSSLHKVADIYRNNCLS